MAKINCMKMMIVFFAVVFSCMTLFNIRMEPVTAAETNPSDQVTAGKSRDVDEEAHTILKKATDYLTSLKEFRLKVIDITDVVQESGQKLQFSSTARVTVKRPNRLYVSRMRDDGSIRQIWYNNKMVTIYEDTENAYGQISVPDTIDEMLDFLEEIIESPQPLADLLHNNLSHLTELPLSGRYVGISNLDTITCDHLAFRGEIVDWQLWVDRSEKPFIQKVVITYKELPGEPQFAARIVEWDVQPNISDTLFQFSIPEGARQIKVVVSKRGDTGEGGAQ